MHSSFDFMPIGSEIKRSRKAAGMTRAAAAKMLAISSRHLQAVENDGQHPSFDLFIQIITMFDISIDRYIFPEQVAPKSSVRRRVDALLDALNDRELTIIEGTATAICAAKETENVRNYLRN